MFNKKTKQMKKPKINDENRQPSVVFCTPSSSKINSQSTPNSQCPMHLNASGQTLRRRHSNNQLYQPFHETSISQICIDGSHQHLTEGQKNLLQTLQMLNSLVGELNKMHQIAS